MRFYECIAFCYGLAFGLASGMIVAKALSDQTPAVTRVVGAEPANATVVSVYDGDTITLDVDLGWGVQLSRQVMRLHGVDAPEVRGSSRKEGLAARNALREMLPVGCSVDVSQRGKGKYGRWIVSVSKNGEDISNWLVEHGHATFVEY